MKRNEKDSHDILILRVYLFYILFQIVRFTIIFIIILLLYLKKEIKLIEFYILYVLFLLKARNFTHFVISIKNWYTYDIYMIIKEYINGHKMYCNLKWDYKYKINLIIKIYIAIKIDIYTFIHSKLIFIILNIILNI